MTAGKRWLFLLGLMLLLPGVRAIAQEATIVGSVTDQTGAVVPGATITITSTDTGQARVFTTAADGEFVAPALSIGHYSIKVAAKSFKTSEKSGLTLNVGDRIREDFQLQVGNAEQTVEVTGAAEVHLQTESGEVSDLISGKQIAQLTTNGKSVYTLVNLTPGASSVQPDFQVPVPVGGDANVSFNGQRMAHNLYLLDGGENLDRGGAGTFSVMPSLESLAEFRVLSSNYSAEYGLSSSATMTTVLKQGGKEFHGSAWEFNRNDAFDARNYFNTKPNKVAKLRFNTYGFNIGGPVSFHPNSGNPNTFFFYNMEWRKLIQGQTLNQAVPYPSTYGGSFASALPADSKDGNGIVVAHSGLHVPCAYQLSPQLTTAFINAGITTFSTPGSDGSCGLAAKGGTSPIYQPYPNNAIPAALLNANAQTLLAAKIFPAPTDATQFKGGNNQPTDVREEIVRVDHRFGDKFNIFGHWISEQILQTYGTTMWSGDNVPTIGNTFGNPSYSAVIHATHTINTNLLNETAFNYNGNRIHILPKAQFGAPLNAPSGFSFNRIFTGPNTIIPTINLANLGTQYSANWTPWNNKADDYQIRDDVSWVRGAHQFKFGASWALYKKIQDAFAAPQGNFQFNGFYSGNDFADFLLGYSNSYQEDAIHDSGHWNNVSWAAYLQDNWRVNSRLTLNLGLRWDGVPHTYEANHRASNFYPSLYKAADAATFDSNGNICSGPGNGCAAASPGLGTSPNAILAGYQFYTNGLGIDGLNGIPKGMVDNHWAAFGPRIGFAYDLTGRGKTVLRGGFGIMYERIQGNDMYNGATNVPFDAKVNFSNVLLSNPHTSTQTGATLAVPIVPGAIVGMDRAMYKLPVSTQYSAGIQQELSPRTLLSVSYVGTQNRHLNDWLQANLPPESMLASLIAGGGAGLNQKVQYLGYGEIRMARNEANSQYNSLQMDLHTVIHNDLQAQFGYTLSKAYDPVTNNGGNGGDLNYVNNPYAGWKYDWGPSLFDRPNIAFVNFMYDTPWFRSAANPFVKTVLGGWGLSGIVTMQSGAPLEPLVGGTQGGQGLTGLNARTRPDLVGSISYPKTLTSAGIQWFDPAAFKAPTPGAWGNLKHSAVRGPGRDDWNLALHKNFNIAEKANFEFRAEAFNIWNHTQFRADQQAGGYGQNLTGTNFGVITQAHDPRVLQLGGKFSF